LSDCDRRKRRRQRIKDYLNNIKLTSGCVHCHSKSHLTFHHICPRDKIDSVSNIYRRTASWNKTKQEIRKCVVLCYDCQKELHGFK
jgi:5-methylcytosine-specific restriction endonuclease McrA